ncbi:MAG TPA: hypothetical protein VFY89_10315, partial [Ktedonobacterales bacterium]
MPMGRERAVIRWDAHAALLARERARLEAELATLAAPDAPATPERRRQTERLRQSLRTVLSRQR